jgi:hypothetical protein
MDIELAVGIAVLVAAPLVWWGYQRYKTMMADGKITLDEVIDAVGDVIEEVKDAKDKAADLKKKK